MRQIVSLIKDNQVHYALVDTDSGEMIPFADLLIPDPDRFGLHESALLGTNLIDVLGLNGAKRPKVADIHVGSLAPTMRQPSAPEPEALPPAADAPKAETPRQRKLRLDRERWHTRKQPARGDNRRRSDAGPSGKGGTLRYISEQEVLDIVAQYPDGISIPNIAERIWRLTDGRGTDDEKPGWVYAGVMNRINMMRTRAEAKSDYKLPFRQGEGWRPDKQGQPTQRKMPMLYPLTPIAT